jgi:hypothetical protein
MQITENEVGTPIYDAVARRQRRNRRLDELLPLISVAGSLILLAILVVH